MPKYLLFVQIHFIRKSFGTVYRMHLGLCVCVCVCVFVCLCVMLCMSDIQGNWAQFKFPPQCSGSLEKEAETG